jgi:hypothetical protein
MRAQPPLLMLAEGRKPRARREKIPAAKEIKLHVQVAELLRAHCLPDWRWRHISGKAKDAREGAILKKMGASAGWPDFILISPLGISHFLELKRRGEKPSEAQEDFRKWCLWEGIPHVIARTVDEVLAVLDSWDCLRIKI